MPDGTEGQRHEAAVRAFVENAAMALDDYGFPRMPARVLMTLMAADEPSLSALDLADRLEVSPAAISGAVRYLMRIGLLVKEPVPGSRRDRYRMPDDAWYAAAMTKSDFFDDIVRLTDEGVTACGGRDTPAGARVAEMRDFYEFLRKEMGDLLTRWEAHRESLGYRARPPAR
ncbi:MAG: MarR family transcriptional regulator [Propionibacteriales bacterium]|nr:MarR family transcriptional regulator [Propionibacteriales bacterium]